MNKTVLMLALAGLIAAPAVVKAEEAAAPAAATEAAAAVEHEMEDGSKIVVEGDMVSVVDKEGKKTAAPDGEHKAKDGTVVVVKEGKLVK